jgi:hypothetical protein
MSDLVKYLIMGALGVTFVTLVLTFAHVERKPIPAKIEKVATVKLSTGGAIEVIGLNHRGHQCYLLVGQSQNNPVFTRAELVCP